jgi:hypothetical protein
VERICESVFLVHLSLSKLFTGWSAYPPSPSLPMDLSLCWIPTNNRVSSAHLELQRFSPTYKTHMTTTLGARGLQLRNWNEERECTTTVRMSAADGSEQGKSDRATVFDESKRLLAKQKELLQQVNPASFPFLVASHRVCSLSARAFRCELEHRFFCILFIQTCVQLFFWWRLRRFALFCGSVFRSDCAIGMRHCFSCTFF